MQFVGQLTAKSKGSAYTLESLENHVRHVRDNSLDVNAGLRKVLVHLRGEEISGQGVGETAPACGKLAELSTALQGTRDNQEETFRLITELLELFNVNA